MSRIVSIVAAAALLALLAPATPATATVISQLCLECIFEALPGCATTVQGDEVCWWVNPYDCSGASAHVASRTVTTKPVVVHGGSFSTAPVDVGPVHVGSVTVSWDTIYVLGGTSTTTPSRSVSDELCTGPFVGGLA